MSESEGRFHVTPSVGNHFAWLRTQLGLQRTLMAAARTSVSLIGFGFTVAQFFERVRGVEGMEQIGVELPRNLGLVLIAAGVLSLAVFTWQYHVANEYLRSGEFAVLADTGKPRMRTPTYVVAIVVMIIGMAAFASVFLHF